MGASSADVETVLKNTVSCSRSIQGVVLAAPASAMFLDQFVNRTNRGLTLRERWRYSRHINLDDIDIGTDGVFGTVSRVIGRHGLVLWDVGKNC